MIEDPTKTIFEFVEFPIADGDVMQIESSNADPPPVKGGNDLSGSLDSVYVYYRPSAQERYRWFTRSLVAKRVLLGISVVLIGLGLLMCCLSVLRKDSDRANGRKVCLTYVYAALGVLGGDLLLGSFCTSTKQL